MRDGVSLSLHIRQVSFVLPAELSQLKVLNVTSNTQALSMYEGDDEILDFAC